MSFGPVRAWSLGWVGEIRTGTTAAVATKTTISSAANTICRRFQFAGVSMTAQPFIVRFVPSGCAESRPRQSLCCTGDRAGG
jgi:hypothetical protein